MKNTLFIGDSFPAGSGVQDRNLAYPELLARAVGMHAEFDAQGGTGFINDGPGSPSGATSRLAERLDATAATFPDAELLIIDAGRNDLDSPAGEVGAAVSDYLARVRDHWPQAQIVVIVPTFISAHQRPDYEPLQRLIADAVSRIGGTVIDPVADHWYDNVQTGDLLDTDGIHPNAKGHALLARQLERSLQSHEIAAA